MGKIVATNRKARHDYVVEDTLEAGIALTGTEIKSVRESQVNLQDAYARIERGEAWLVGARIAPWAGGNRYKAFHWPGSEIGEAYDEVNVMAMVREQAYAIRHLRAPSLPIPASPTLLLISNPNAISWQGSVGATVYEVERGPSIEGPWTVVGTDVPEDFVQYRPLFVDQQVPPGEWFYRVRARNASGQRHSRRLTDSLEKIGSSCRQMDGFTFRPPKPTQTALCAKTELIPNSESSVWIPLGCERITDHGISEDRGGKAHAMARKGNFRIPVRLLCPLVGVQFIGRENSRPQTAKQAP